jgi:hypothetical protein
LRRADTRFILIDSFRVAAVRLYDPVPRLLPLAPRPIRRFAVGPLNASMARRIFETSVSSSEA